MKNGNTQQLQYKAYHVLSVTVNGIQHQKKGRFLCILITCMLLLSAAPAAWSNMQPDPPQLQWPLNQEPAFPDVYVYFNWLPGAAAGSSDVYDIYLGADPASMQLLAENTTNGSSNDSCVIILHQDTFLLYYFNPLLPNTTWYWKVVAKDNAGNSAESSVWSFTIANINLNAPTKPVNPVPANNNLNTDHYPLLQWDESTDQDGDIPVYDVYLSTNSNPTTKVVTGLAGHAFKINTPLKGNTVYYWKVAARDRDTGYNEVTSDTWNFTTRNTAPAAIILSYPAHQAVAIDFNPTLSWQPAYDADDDSVYYELWYSSGAAPVKQLVTGNTYVSAVLAANTTYNWKIIAIDSHGDSSESAVSTFTTRSNSSNTAPSAPALLSPANNSTNILLQQTLQWSAATDTDPVQYTVYMGIDPNNLQQVATQLTGTDYTLWLQAATTYYWKVVAFDNIGGVTESSTFSFTTTADDPGMADLRVYYRYGDVAIYKYEQDVLWPAFEVTGASYTTRGRSTFKNGIAVVLYYSNPNTVVSFDLPAGFTATSNIIYNKGLPTDATIAYMIEGSFSTHNTITVHLQSGNTVRSYTIDAQVNQLPAVPVLTGPADRKAGVPVTPVLTWTGGNDPDNSSTLYRIFMGITADQLLPKGPAQNQKSYTITTALEGAQKYFWKVVATDEEGESTESDVHSFVTQSVLPSVPVLEYPREISTYIETAPTLTWRFTDDPSVTYDVYLDKNNPPQRIARGITGNTYTAQNLAHNTNYYWKVTAINQQGQPISSKTGQFITKPENGRETGTFTDIRDGQIYQWVSINGQQWMTHNLSYLPKAKDGYYGYEYSGNGNTKSYVALNNINANVSKYGYLYNWQGALNFAADPDTGNAIQGVCPCGWHVATPEDWQKLYPLTTDRTTQLHYSTWGIPGKENEWLNSSGLSMLPTSAWNTQGLKATDFWLADRDRVSPGIYGFRWDKVNNNFYSVTPPAMSSVRCVKNAPDNHPPGRPVLTSPASNSQGNPFSISLQWAAAADPDGDAVVYDLYVDTLPDPERLLQSGISSTSYQFTETEQGKTYYWKVRARDPHVEIAESEIWSFTIQTNNSNTAPAVPQLLLPAHEGTGVPVAPTLQWSSATDADGDAVTYNLYVGKEEAGLQALATGLVTNTYSLSNLHSSTTWYWKVVAVDGKGGMAGSTVNKFTTINHAPNAPVLSSPANGINGFVMGANLTWQASADPDGDKIYYIVKIGTSATDLTVLNSTTLNNYFHFDGTFVTLDTEFFWQVIATDGKGGETASDIWRFKIYKNFFSTQVELVSPANDETNVGLAPKLTWKKPAGGYTFYDVYMYGEGVSYIQLAANLTDSFFTVNGLQQPGNLWPHSYYVWKVVAKDNLGNIIQSDYRRFRTLNRLPGQPTLVTPANTATGIPYSLALTWTTVTDPDGDQLSYDVYLDTGPNPTTLLASGVSGDRYTASMLLPNTTYYWKVVVKDNYGGEVASNISSFTIQNNTQNTAPAAPQLLTPASYESNVRNNSSLAWAAAFDIDGDALQYDVYLDTDPALSTAVATGLTGLSYATSSLINGTTYYWKIVARDGNGGETGSPVWKFTVKNNAPSAPVLLTPAMDSLLTTGTVILTWNVAQDPDNDPLVYDVYLDQNPQATTLLAAGLTNLTYTTPVIPNNVVHYWKVVARDPLGSATASTVFTFTGKNDPPAAPVLQLPANNSNIGSATATLGWQASTDTDSDDLIYEVYTGTQPGSLSKKGTISGTSFTTGALQENTVYYWKVVVKDNLKGTAESAMWSFTRQSSAPNQPPAVPVLISPADQSTGLDGQQVTFNWTAAPDPESDPVVYDLYVSANTQADTKVAANLQSVQYIHYNLLPNTAYSWKIIARDDHGNTSSSSVHQFTTGNAYSISGLVTNSTGTALPQVTLSGFPQTVVTNAQGQYTAHVPPHWSGTVTATLTDYDFSPASRSFTDVQADVTGQDFTGTYTGTYTVSGKITGPGNQPLANVVLNGFPVAVSTNANGEFSVPVSPGFSGAITPVLTGYQFIPESIDLTNVQGNMTGQDFTASVITAVNEPGLDDLIKVYPNPATGPVQITLPESIYQWQLELYTAKGHRIMQQTVSGNNRSVLLTIPYKGIYILRLRNRQQTISRKIVVL